MQGLAYIKCILTWLTVWALILVEKSISKNQAFGSIPSNGQLNDILPESSLLKAWQQLSVSDSHPTAICKASYFQSDTFVKVLSSPFLTMIFNVPLPRLWFTVVLLGHSHKANYLLQPFHNTCTHSDMLVIIYASQCWLCHVIPASPCNLSIISW